MRDNKRQVEKTWKIVIVLTVIAIVAIFSQDLIREIVLFRNEISNLQESFSDNIVEELQYEVDFRTEEINDIYSKINITIYENSSLKVESLAFTIDETLELLNAPSNTEELAQIIEVIESNKAYDDIHDYYVINDQGVLLYDGGLAQEVSVNMIDTVDAFNRLYIDNMINDIELSPSKFTTIDTYQLVEDDTIQMVISAKKITNTNLIIYTICSMKDAISNELNRYSASLYDYYSEKDGSLFIFDTSGMIYLHRDVELIGTNISDVEDENILLVIEKIKDFSNENGKGVFSVNYFKNLEDGETSDRLIYINTIDELGLIIGNTEDSEIYDYIIKDFQRTSLQNSLMILIPIYTIFIVLLAIVITKILKINKLSMQLVKEEEDLYHLFSDITEDIILITEKNGRIIFANKLGKETLFKDQEITELNLDEIMVDEEGYKVLIGIKENYYIKYSVSQVIYDGVECDLYIVDDVTEKVTTERKLEAMTLSDDLTGLGNRRLLARDYKDYILPSIKDGNVAYLAMIDIDNFKQANDDYGHSYGDDVLIIISNIFKAEMDKDLKIYRVGGDEFALLATNKTENECLQILRKLKNKVSTYRYTKIVKLGFSAGITEINVHDAKRRLSDYYERADKLLYEAKEAGKDRIVK